MRILIVSSCTGEKTVTHESQLNREDFAKGEIHVEQKENSLSEYMTSAQELYSGPQHKRLMRGVAALRAERGQTVHLWILSAGYGVVPAERKLAPYESTFSGMKKAELRTWADELHVPADIRKVLADPYDLAIILLGDDYLRACDLDGQVELGGPTLFFVGKAAASRLPRFSAARSVALTNAEAKRFRCGLIGLKGEMTARLLERLAKKTREIDKFIDPATNILDLLDSGGESNQIRDKPRANSKVDQVIKLPDSWQSKPHRNKLRYFIPEWDDLVDPDYDFDADIHAGGSGDWTNEVYAHQMYPEPNYDGILISKVVAEKSKKKKERINALGVHRFLRVPRDYPVMGDCGAFGYINQDEPPYSTEEILDYYTRLDFDLGVSVDHLIVTATEAQKQHRYDLTIHNAEDFLKEHRKRVLPWVPIGAVQGWDPKSYAEAARQFVAMGYKYIALGGLVRSPTKEILRVLTEVHKVVPSGVAIHLFGLARLDALKDFAKMGVRSVDSASLLRRAWMGTGQNYLTDSGELYAAIRIPDATKSFRAKRMVSEGRATLKQVQKHERACLHAIHEFDQGKRDPDSTLDVLMEYDHLITPDRPDNREVLKRTLEAAPWKNCNCEICQKDGVDVVIFRGNNRNRRRGFHNTYVFYRLLQRALAGEVVELNPKTKIPGAERQPDLFSSDEATGCGAEYRARCTMGRPVCPAL